MSTTYRNRSPLQFNDNATEINRRAFDTPDGRITVTFETPYTGNRQEAGTPPTPPATVANAAPSRVQFTGFDGPNGWYVADLHARMAGERLQECISREMLLCAPESDGRQYAVTEGGMRVRIK